MLNAIIIGAFGSCTQPVGADALGGPQTCIQPVGDGVLDVPRICTQPVEAPYTLAVARGPALSP